MFILTRCYVFFEILAGSMFIVGWTNILVIHTRLQCNFYNFDIPALLYDGCLSYAFKLLPASCNDVLPDVVVIWVGFIM